MSWPCSSSAYELQERIGRGAFSTVWRALCSKPSSEVRVAIKITDLENVQSSFEDILQEVQTMRLSDDVNILQFYCSFVQQDQLWLVTQLMDMGSCLRVMSVAKSAGFGEGMNEEWLAYILREALQGLSYLHGNGQIHRDMKAGNILLDSAGCVRLADFGVSGWTLAGGQRQETVNTFVGTPCYMAPEVMEQAGGYDNRADIWSMGITALELAKGRAPYAHLSPMRVLIVTIEEDPPSLKSYSSDLQRSGAPFSAEFDDFYKRCLQKKPRMRPSADDLLKHKFLSGRSPEALLNQLLNHISIVGQAEHDQRVIEDTTSSKLPGESVISIEKLDDPADSDASSSADSSLLLQDAVGGEGVEGGIVSSQEALGTSGDGAAAAAGSGGSFSSNSSSSSPSPRSMASKPEYVAGTTWVFDSDDAGSSGEFRLSSSRGHYSSRRVQSIGSRQQISSSSTSSVSPKAVNIAGPLSPSLDDFLTDFESEASTLPSVPRDAKDAKDGKDVVKPPSRPSEEEEAPSLNDFIDDLESLCAAEK